MSTEMTLESIARRESEMAENRRIRERALIKAPEERGLILEKNPEFTVSLNPQDIAQDWADRLLGNIQATHPEMARYIEVYGEYYGLKNVAILNAHANVKKETTRTGKLKHIWAYRNNGKYYNIQGAINQLDSEFSALVLLSCYYNHNFNLTSKKSLLLTPDRDIEIAELEGTPGICEVVYFLYDPNFKEKKDRIITSHTISTALKDLESKNRIKMLREAAEKGLQEIDY